MQSYSAETPYERNQSALMFKCNLRSSHVIKTLFAMGIGYLV